jgi:lipopolysaccharide/colanic/teichoic acid biosynthesis glycosyltransferase
MSASVYSSIHQRTGPDDLSRADRAGHRRGRRSYRWSKRLLDLIGSAVLLIALFPLLVAIAMGVRLSSRGPALFMQRRLGRGGARFWCYKLRTMVTDAELQLAERQDLRGRFLENYKLDNDPRVTRFGSFLRRTSLDELPQLWNVLRGEMSLIGPRPIVEPELSKYGDNADRLLTVKPGLGGVWQVSGRSDTTYPERVLMDMHYIENQSLRFDLSLIIQTVQAVFRRRGAR